MINIKDYSFVYTLSYNDNIFYVGKAKDVVKRYKEHLACKRECELYKYISYIKSIGNLPKLNIITYQHDKESASIEQTLIKCLSIGGHKLLNIAAVMKEKNATHSHDKKEYINSILKIQDDLKKKASTWGGYYSTSIDKYKKIKDDEE